MPTATEIRASLAASFSGLNQLLTDGQIDAVLAAPTTHKPQPLAGLIRMAPVDATGNEHARQVLANTDWAVRGILGRGSSGLKQWIAGRVNDACAVRDYENVTAALGEVRSAGFLAQSGFDVENVRTARSKTPDFRLNGFPTPVFVEVFTKNMHGDEAKALKDFLRQPSPKPSAGGAVIREHVVRPAGAPKQGETTVENLAQKFAGIKPRGEQAAREHPTVLWVDVQDADWWSVGGQDAQPAWVGADGQFFTSGLWHAFYGLKGTSMLEGHATSLPWKKPIGMPFDGMFAQHASWSAVVLGFPRRTVVFENPWANRTLPLAFTEHLLNLRWFDWPRSWMAWPPRFRWRLLPARLQLSLAHRRLAGRVKEMRGNLADLGRAAPGRW